MAFAVEVALALLWPWLGTVKRQQALLARELVARQYTTGTCTRRPSRYRPPLAAHARPSTAGASPLAQAWAAGFLDAEGYFGTRPGHMRADGSFALRVRASASQHGTPNVAPEVLERLRVTVGGRIERHGEVDDFKWVLEGAGRVQALADSLRPWLGAVKLRQADAAIAAAHGSRSSIGRTSARTGNDSPPP